MFTSQAFDSISFKNRSIEVDCRDHRMSKMNLYLI